MSWIIITNVIIIFFNVFFLVIINGDGGAGAGAGSCSTGDSMLLSTFSI